LHLSAARFVSILGTEVHANPASKAEGKIALAELRQKKKEYALRRRALVSQQRAAKDAAERAEGTATQNKKRGFAALIGKLFRKAKARTPKRDLAEIDADLAAVDEILFNLDSCAVQIEGKLLQLG
jgi:hypothetical protein